MMRPATPHKPVDLISTYTPLILSLFYFVAIDMQSVTKPEVALLIALYLVQLVLYQLAECLPSSQKLWAVGTMITLCFATSSINPSSYAFYWYAIYFSALYFSVHMAFLVFFVITALVSLSAYLYGYGNYWYFVPALVPSVAMFGHGYYEKRSMLYAEAQRKSEQEIGQLAKVAERERIARDLHDVMGHRLATIALKTQLAQKQGKAGRYDAAMQEIAEVAKITSEALSEMRSVISGYRFRSIEHHVHKMIRSLEDAGFNVSAQLDLPEMDAKTESTLALILTEAVTNIIKHSRGNEVNIAVKDQEERGFAVRVADNGAVHKLPEGNGMQGMRERIAQLGGELRIELEEGVALLFSVPHQTGESA